MWHFGTDSLSEYAGEKFEMTWEDGEHALLRIYSKDMKEGNGIRIRKERQEYPGVRLDAAVHESYACNQVLARFVSDFLE